MSDISNYQHIDCERRIAELTAQVESLQNRWASRPLSNADLRDRLATACDMLRNVTKVTRVTPNVIAAIEEFLSVPTP